MLKAHKLGTLRINVVNTAELNMLFKILKYRFGISFYTPYTATNLYKLFHR